MKKYYLGFLIFSILICMTQSVLAVCPVCTVAVAGGVVILRELGIDDMISGMWVGALIVSSIIWLLDWLNRKKITFLFKKIIVIVSFYFIFVWPLYYFKLFPPPGTILGIDRLLFGIGMGTLIFILAVLSDSYIKKNNENRALIKYQKVLIPIIYLIIASIVIYLLLII
jgi:hypothetical protein